MRGWRIPPHGRLRALRGVRQHHHLPTVPHGGMHRSRRWRSADGLHARPLIILHRIAPQCAIGASARRLHAAIGEQRAAIPDCRAVRMRRTIRQRAPDVMRRIVGRRRAHAAGAIRAIAAEDDQLLPGPHGHGTAPWRGYWPRGPNARQRKGACRRQRRRMPALFAHDHRQQDCKHENANDGNDSQRTSLGIDPPMPVAHVVTR